MSIAWWFRSPTIGEALKRPRSLRMRIYLARHTDFLERARALKTALGPARDAGDEAQRQFEKGIDPARRQNVEDAVDQWHEHPDPEIGPLHKFLGWTWAEYKAYMERDELPPFRQGAL